MSDIIKILSGKEPIASLSSDTVRKLADHCVLEKHEAGAIILKAGESDEKSVYLVSGTIRLMSAEDETKVMRTLQAGEQEAIYPVDERQPHGITAVADSPCEIVRIKIDLLDKLIAEDQLAVCQTSVGGAGGKPGRPGDTNFFKKLLDRLLGRFLGGTRAVREDVDIFALVARFRPPLLKTLSEDELKEICARMEAISVSGGCAVIRQGGEGDHYYMIVNGVARVTRVVEEGAEPILLAELGEGETFGEEALLSNAKRNATVSMKSKGMLLRLAKRDFIELLKEPMLKWFSPIEAGEIIHHGGKWLDVRPVSDFQRSHLGGAVSMPLHELRDRIEELEEGTTYVCCCDTGRLSCSAAFLLAQRGYNVAILRGGLQRFSGD